jgi:hypothetical protein
VTRLGRRWSASPQGNPGGAERGRHNDVGSLPTACKMYVYVPRNLATAPGILKGWAEPEISRCFGLDGTSPIEPRDGGTGSDASLGTGGAVRWWRQLNHQGRGFEQWLQLPHRQRGRPSRHAVPHGAPRCGAGPPQGSAQRIASLRVGEVRSYSFGASTRIISRRNARRMAS